MPRPGNTTTPKKDDKDSKEEEKMQSASFITPNTSPKRGRSLQSPLVRGIYERRMSARSSPGVLKNNSKYTKSTHKSPQFQIGTPSPIQKNEGTEDRFVLSEIDSTPKTEFGKSNVENMLQQILNAQMQQSLQISKLQGEIDILKTHNTTADPKVKLLSSTNISNVKTDVTKTKSKRRVSLSPEAKSNDGRRSLSSYRSGSRTRIDTTKVTKSKRDQSTSGCSRYSSEDEESNVSDACSVATWFHSASESEQSDTEMVPTDEAPRWLIEQKKKKRFCVTSEANLYLATCPSIDNMTSQQAIRKLKQFLTLCNENKVKPQLVRNHLYKNLSNSKILGKRVTGLSMTTPLAKLMQIAEQELKKRGIDEGNGVIVKLLKDHRYEGQKVSDFLIDWYNQYQLFTRGGGNFKVSNVSELLLELCEIDDQQKNTLSLVLDKKSTITTTIKYIKRVCGNVSVGGRKKNKQHKKALLTTPEDDENDEDRALLTTPATTGEQKSDTTKKKQDYCSQGCFCRVISSGERCDKKHSSFDYAYLMAKRRVAKDQKIEVNKVNADQISRLKIDSFETKLQERKKQAAEKRDAATAAGAAEK